MYASSGGADRRAAVLRRLGCQRIKVRTLETYNREEKALDKSKVKQDTKEAWNAVDAASITTNTGVDEMGIDTSEAHRRASELWEQGVNKEAVVKALNAEFEPTFFKTTSGIYAVNEPDYLPEILVLECKGRNE